MTHRGPGARTGGQGVTIQEDQPAHLTRRVQGGPGRDGRAAGVPDQDGPYGVHGLVEGEQLPGQVPGVVRAAPLAVAGPGEVQGVDAVAGPGQVRAEAAPGVRGLGEAVHEHDRAAAGPPLEVPGTDVTGLDVRHTTRDPGTARRDGVEDQRPGGGEQEEGRHGDARTPQPPSPPGISPRRGGLGIIHLNTS